MSIYPEGLVKWRGFSYIAVDQGRRLRVGMSSQWRNIKLLTNPKRPRQVWKAYQKRLATDRDKLILSSEVFSRPNNVFKFLEVHLTLEEKIHTSPSFLFDNIRTPE
jgi:hypothetical protein